MKTTQDLKPIIDQIADPESPVGMNAVYVHAVIIDKLMQIEARMEAIERRLDGRQPDSTE